MDIAGSTKFVAVAAALTIAIVPGTALNAEPQPVMLLSSLEMPQQVPQLAIVKQSESDFSVPEGVRLYHELRQSFDVSHTVMANWLGVKRRTLYNWMSQESKVSKLGAQIESRLIELNKFKSEVELEHVKLVNKIAFSPIYGDAAFGVDILNGCNSGVLIKWYDKLFSRFESYKVVQSKNEQIS